MALLHPFPVYGKVTDAGAAVNLGNVYVKDITAGSSTVTTTSDANGKYVLELMGIASNGDTMNVWAFATDGKYKLEAFVLNISSTATEKNLAVANYPLADSTIAPTETLTKSFSKALSETINAPTEALTKSFSKALSDAINAATDALVKDFSKALSDSTVAPTEALIKSFSKALSDAINVPTESLTKSFSKVLADSINAPTDLLVASITIRFPLTVTAVEDEYYKIYESPEEQYKIEEDINEFYKIYESIDELYKIKEDLKKYYNITEEN